MRLENLIQQCTVELGVRGHDSGTGFFIAPGYILSCEHVVRHMGASIPVRWGHTSGFSEATVVEVFSKFDIGILRFDPPRADLPCVFLDESDPEITDKLYLFGYGSASPNGDPVIVSVEGKTGDRPSYIKYQVGAIKPGMSGAALVNCRTGKVCGMSKYTMNSNSLEGGGGVSLSTIRGCLSLHYPEILESQALFHQQDKRWQTASSLLVPAVNADKPSTSTSNSSQGFYRRRLTKLQEELSAVEANLETALGGVDQLKLERQAEQLLAQIEELNSRLG